MDHAGQSGGWADADPSCRKGPSDRVARLDLSTHSSSFVRPNALAHSSLSVRSSSYTASSRSNSSVLGDPRSSVLVNPRPLGWQDPLDQPARPGRTADYSSSAA